MDKKINVISDLEGNEIIIINDIRFKGKRRIDWEYVEQYLKEYIGNCIEMLIRHAADGNLYLYDMVNIKKETSTPLEP